MAVEDPARLAVPAQRLRRLLRMGLGSVLLLVLLAVADRAAAPDEQELLAAAERHAEGSVQRGAARSHAHLLAARAASGSDPDVYLLGPGRALSAQAVAAVVGNAAQVHDLTHAGAGPFELLGLAHELPAGVVLLEFSCLDTHGPLVLGLGTAPGSLAALRRLEHLLGPARGVLSGSLHLSLWAAGLSSWVRFHDLLADPYDGFLTLGPTRQRLDLPQDTPLAADLPSALVACCELWPQRLEVDLAREIESCQDVSAGASAEIQVALLIEAVIALRASGSSVLLVEAPLHPLTRQLFSRPLRAQLLESLAPLLRDTSVRLLTEQQTGPYPSREFAGLFDLLEVGRQRMAEGLQDSLGHLLPAGQRAMLPR